MPSLSEAYQRRERDWEGRDPRRVSVGGGLFLLGTAAIVTAILTVTTGVSALLGADTAIAAKRLAGALAGLGFPALFLGVVVVLPASQRNRAGVALGTLLSVAGVALFWHAYPVNWTNSANSLAFETAMLYFLGSAVALWFVFSAIANFKLRNNPQGDVRLEVTRAGETKTLHVSQNDYKRYKQAIRGDGGETQSVIQEIQSRYDD